MLQRFTLPYCTQCGGSIGETDQYCAGCGARQTSTASPGTRPSGARPSGGGDFLNEMNPRTVSLLCYIPILGWIPSIFLLASQRFRHDQPARFHAFQGLYIFVAWLLVDWVLKPILRGGGFGFGSYPLVGLLKALLFGAWIWMMVKVSQNESFKLPFFGELAERSASEQR
jgi:uncharacterized membrane protein